ncbi:MAG: TIM barrel protein [Bilophila sp.]
MLDVMRWGMTSEAGSSERAKAEEAIAAAVSGAAEMGIARIILPSFKASAIRSRDDLRETARTLRLACALAQRHGMSVATENLLDGEMQQALFHIVGYDNLRLLLDLSNFTLRRRDEVFEALPSFAAAGDGVHVKDGLYGEPGVRPLGRATPG